ncbi:MAG: T9SS type A sorting domain-containing protein [Bacteroidota bacterium]
MSRFNLLLFGFFLLNSLTAQMIIEDEASLYCVGNPRIVLNNLDLVSFGQIFPGQSSISFEGSSSDNILQLSDDRQLYDLRIDKPNQQVWLDDDLDLIHELLFVSGKLDLNGFEFFIEGNFVNETETSRLIGPAGGQVYTEGYLDPGSGLAPGNLGFEISSNQELENFQLYRAHFPANLPGDEEAIERYFRFSTSADDPDASVILHYFDAEIGGLDETDLGVWYRPNSGNTWQLIPYDEHDMVNNFFLLEERDPSGQWTIGTTSGALPLELLSFQAWIAGPNNVLEWETVNEVNTDKFLIEASIDQGRSWQIIGEQAAAGHATDLRKYNYTDYRPAAITHYRLQMYDLDGSFQYSPIIQLSRTAIPTVQVYPNPAIDQLWFNHSSHEQYPHKVTIYEASGRRVLEQENWSIGEALNISMLPVGQYSIELQTDQKLTILIFTKS